MKAQKLVIFGSASLLMGLLAAQLYAGEPKAPGKAGKTAKAAEAEAPEKKTKKPRVIEGPEGLRFSLTSESVAKIYDKVFDADFLPRYKKAEPGPAMSALDKELEDRKSELRRRFDFGDTPSAFENTAIKSEFTYNNGESLTHTTLSRVMMNDDLQAERSVGYHRYFFYFGDKLWKIYDEYKVGKKGAYSSFDQGVQKLSAQLGAKAVLLKPDGQREYTTAQWHVNDPKVGEVVVQLLDRQEDGYLAIAYVQKSTLDNLAKLRSNKPESEGVSSEVQSATSKSSSKPKFDSSPADAYTRKKQKKQDDE